MIHTEKRECHAVEGVSNETEAVSIVLQNAYDSHDLPEPFSNHYVAACDAIAAHMITGGQAEAAELSDGRWCVLFESDA